MKNSGAKLSDVQSIYSGAVRDLWVLCMGEQIHAGGMMSSMELAKSAGIKEGMHGVDLCSCLGAGMRFLAKNFKVKMDGVDATPAAIAKAKEAAAAEKMSDKLNFIEADVTKIPVDAGKYDFVWGEDAWCYVEDKEKLISEASRIVKKGGVIAFTDWIDGPKGLTEEEAFRINDFMKFPYMESLDGYKNLMTKYGFEVREATYIPFAKYVDLYLTMLTEQHTYDALRIIGDDMNMFQAMGAEFGFIQEKAHQDKITRGRFVGVKK